MSNSNKRAYDTTDVEELSPRAQRVILAVADQTGETTPDTGNETESDGSGDEGGAGEGERVVCTTSRLREALNMSNDEISYELRKLEGGYRYSVTTPLLETTPQGVNENGVQKPKRIMLTEAGRQAVHDNVLEYDTLHSGPDWLPQTSDVNTKIAAIANHVNALETVYNQHARELGLTTATDVLAAGLNESAGDENTAEHASDVNDIKNLTRDALVDNPDEAKTFVFNENTLLALIDKIATGQKANVKALQALGENPREHMQQPGNTRDTGNTNRDSGRDGGAGVKHNE